MAKKTTKPELADIVEGVRDTLIKLDKAKRLFPEEYHKAILQLSRKDALALLNTTAGFLIGVTTLAIDARTPPQSKSPHK